MGRGQRRQSSRTETVATSAVTNPIKNSQGTLLWYNSAGQLHREDGPAVEGANGGRKWLINDQLHREDGPAVEWENGAWEWWRNGQLHRMDGPAAMTNDGQLYWYLEGRGMSEEEWLEEKGKILATTVVITASKRGRTSALAE